MSLCGYVLYIQLKKWYVKFGATGSLSGRLSFQISVYFTIYGHAATQSITSPTK